MLVLSRRIGESIHISTNIVVTVLGVNGKNVRVGIDAPRQVGIAREELRVPSVAPRDDIPAENEKCEHANGNQ